MYSSCQWILKVDPVSWTTEPMFMKNVVNILSKLSQLMWDPFAETLYTDKVSLWLDKRECLAKYDS